MSHFRGKHVWIIGASSGIGAALAKQLADEGAVLSLSARNGDALASVLSSLAGIGHKAIPLDVREHADVTAAAAEVAAQPLDSIIVLAAGYEPMDMTALDIPAVRKMLEVNLLGTFHLIEAVLPHLKKQNKGQLALCGSVAGYIGLPHSQPYSATKAAIRNLAESLRGELKDHPGIDVRLISPGFVRTPLTDKNHFPMPCILEPEDAARRLSKGLAGKCFEIHFPKRFTLALKILALLPYPLYFRLMKHFI